MNKSEIKPIDQCDLREIAEIEIFSYPHPWSYEHFLNEINNQYSFSFKILSPSKNIAGYAFSSLVLSDLQINNLCVAPDFRKKGYAQLLLNFLLNRARNFGAHKVFLEVRENNFAAIRLYEKTGFVFVNVRRNFYSNGENALAMVLSL